MRRRRSREVLEVRRRAGSGRVRRLAEFGAGRAVACLQAVLARAIPLLTRGRALSQIAHELGYQSQSAFSAMFRRAFGQSPRAFMMRDAEQTPERTDDVDADDSIMEQFPQP